ncbi:MAG: RecX family transcriptional regulator, partial [Bacteriovoracaceae bacterium]|nr:RecX family transcriptional regulator [Bacteriovoracaceae bacterium]
MADAYQYAIRLLAGQDYSVFKLEQKLRQKGFADEDIQDAISEVERKGYLRPQAYLRHRVLALARKGEAAPLILRQLEFEHLSTNLAEIEALMAEEGLSAETQILYLLQKKLGRSSASPTLTPAAAQKVIAFVLRKG